MQESRWRPWWIRLDGLAIADRGFFRRRPLNKRGNGSIRIERGIYPADLFNRQNDLPSIAVDLI
jgi:hypothetical protein